MLLLSGDTLVGHRLDTNRLELSGQQIAIAERVGSGANGFGSFSAAEADGSRIVFRTNRKGGLVELYQKSSATGSDEVPVLRYETQFAEAPESFNITVVLNWTAGLTN